MKNSNKLKNFMDTYMMMNVYMYIYFLAPDNESQGFLNPTAMTVQKLVILHRRER